jgi:Fe-S cluster assembly protein SufD
MKNVMSTESDATTVSWYEKGIQILESASSASIPSVLHERRIEAQAALQRLGLPSTQAEDWKYTDIRDVRTGNYSLASHSAVSQVDEDVRDLRTLPLDACYRIDTVDGFVATHLEDLQARLPDGVEVFSLSHAGEEQQAFVEQYVGSAATISEDSVAALNTALMQDGIVVRVSKSVCLDAPLYVQHISSGLNEHVASFPRVVVLVEEGAQASIIEHFTAVTASAAFSTSVTELFVEKNANLSHYQVGEDALENIRFSRISCHQHRDSTCKMHSATFGGKLVRNEVHPSLLGENGTTCMYGLSVLTGNQHVDNHTVLDHAVPHCESDERYKGIYDDQSQGVFCGTIIVRPDAQKTNAIQNNAAIVLSEKASINAKPQLKIWADDVKCTHGATVGALDAQQLFYLRSRGVSERDARNMLLRAFAGDVTQEIEYEALRTLIEERVVEKLSL